MIHNDVHLGVLTLCKKPFTLREWARIASVGIAYNILATTNNKWDRNGMVPVSVLPCDFAGWKWASIAS